MQLNSPLSSFPLEAAIDSYPLNLTPDIPVIETVNRQQQEEIASLHAEKKRLESLVEKQRIQLRKIDEKLEREIARREEVEETLCQYLAAIDVTTDGIALLDKNGKYTYLNKAHVELFGY
ncbi:MAG TPA: hypothetical protein DD000_17170, partial [Cyanobacteria bacterium UBA11166]|nr:hypothetical protein [Cyanobacteria bacterium UBA11166]